MFTFILLKVPSTTKTKNEWSYAFTPPDAWMAFPEIDLSYSQFISIFIE
jgi:hypothetical protein